MDDESSPFFQLLRRDAQMLALVLAINERGMVSRAVAFRARRVARPSSVLIASRFSLSFGITVSW
jgi:hypothetical protein